MELRVKVVPRANRLEIVGVLGGRLKIRIAAPPENGKVNQALLLLIADWLGTKNVELLAVPGNGEKTVRVLGIHELSADQMRRLA